MINRRSVDATSQSSVDESGLALRARRPAAVPVAAAGLDRPLSVPARRGGLLFKRSLDVLGAVVGLVLLSPLFLLIALAILVTDGRPVLFRQYRAGRHGRAFRIVKFRTMHVGADMLRDDLRSASEVTGAAFKISSDPRTTRLGQVLRRFSLDELPQLWNVLRGDMSLVGPRPHPFDDVLRYENWHLARLEAKPGMTGLWQVGGRRDTDFDRWVEQDLDYIRHWSPMLDIKILLKTIPAVLSGNGR